MATVVSLMALTMFALAGGAVYLWRRGDSRKQAVLMLVLAAVIAVNVAIWPVPDAGGEALSGRQAEDRR